MRSVAARAMSFDESIYAKLPDDPKIKLAAVTGTQSAASSAKLLYQMLGDPKIVGQLKGDEFTSSKNSSGKINLRTRLRLAVRHFFLALFSKFDKLGSHFAALVKRCLEVGASLEADASDKKPKPASAKRVSFQPGRGLAFGENVAAGIMGSVIGNAISERSHHRSGEGSRSKDVQPNEQEIGRDDEPVGDNRSVDGDSHDAVENRSETHSVDENGDTGSVTGNTNDSTLDDSALDGTEAPSGDVPAMDGTGVGDYSGDGGGFFDTIASFFGGGD